MTSTASTASTSTASNATYGTKTVHNLLAKTWNGSEWVLRPTCSVSTHKAQSLTSAPVTCKTCAKR